MCNVPFQLKKKRANCNSQAFRGKSEYLYGFIKDTTFKYIRLVLKPLLKDRVALGR